jgi:hypothetical protein
MLAVCEAFVRVRRSKIRRLDRRRCRRYGLALQLEDGMVWRILRCCETFLSATQNAFPELRDNGRAMLNVTKRGFPNPVLENRDINVMCANKLREGLRYHWHMGTAHLLSDDDPRERQRWLATQLPSSAGNARAVRVFGTQLLTIRIGTTSRREEAAKLNKASDWAAG